MEIGGTAASCRSDRVDVDTLISRSDANEVVDAAAGLDDRRYLAGKIDKDTVAAVEGVLAAARWELRIRWTPNSTAMQAVGLIRAIKGRGREAEARPRVRAYTIRSFPMPRGATSRTWALPAPAITPADSKAA